MRLHIVRYAGIFDIRINSNNMALLYAFIYKHAYIVDRATMLNGKIGVLCYQQNNVVCPQHILPFDT
ncbi:hypothetical protein PROCOU_16679 [Listeria rocourtiae FSL F6-920]|nr:hypothetical protein PROCOU_16679 [Listeria rocourtiae FSL F6-920]